MKVIRARIRGLGNVIESRWFDLSPRLNLFHLPEEKGRRSFLQTLAAINPLLSCDSTRPFADFPLVDRRQGYSRRILPGKRTVALAIFTATPKLVDALAAVSPQLYEADRIEVGRRLDCSRWINFVEIASSTRWGEIAAELRQLAAWTREFAPGKAARLASLTRSLRQSDRVKDGLDRDLAEWLQSLPPEIVAASRQRVTHLFRAIRRAEDFHAARGIVERHLPVFTVLNVAPGESPLLPLLHRVDQRLAALGGPAAAGDFLERLNRHLAEGQLSGHRLHLQVPAPGAGVELAARPALEAASSAETSLMRLQAAAALSIALSRTCRTEAVLLFDSPERHLPCALQRQLRRFILDAAECCQCCYGYARANIFSRQRGIPRYTVSDLTRPGH